MYHNNRWHLIKTVISIRRLQMFWSKTFNMNKDKNTSWTRNVQMQIDNCEETTKTKWKINTIRIQKRETASQIYNPNPRPTPTTLNNPSPPLIYIRYKYHQYLSSIINTFFSIPILRPNKATHVLSHMVNSIVQLNTNTYMHACPQQW